MRLRSGAAALAGLVLTAGGVLTTATVASAAPAPTPALATAPAAQSGGYQAQGRLHKCTTYKDKYTKFSIKVCMTIIDNRYADPSYTVYTKKKYKKPCMTVKLKRSGKVIRQRTLACAPGEYAFGGANTKKGKYQLVISSERLIVAKNTVSSPELKVW